jgi:hypothetical protein
MYKFAKHDDGCNSPTNDGARQSAWRIDHLKQVSVKAIPLVLTPWTIDHATFYHTARIHAVETGSSQILTLILLYVRIWTGLYSMPSSTASSNMLQEHAVSITSKSRDQHGNSGPCVPTMILLS